MKIIKSPNYDERPQATAIDTIILHYTGMKTADDALKRMCDKKSKVSAHYMIDEDGQIIQLVEEESRAWHAGVSCWRGKEGVNDFSIGIELVNPGHEFGYRQFTPAQMENTERLCKIIMERHPIEQRNIIAHSDVAPDRKEDPGELFDWRLLAAEGVGLFPEISEDGQSTDLLKKGDENERVFELQKNLTAFGYKIIEDGIFSEKTEKVVIAFQRHFIQDKLDGIWGAREQAVLDRLPK